MQKLQSIFAKLKNPERAIDWCQSNVPRVWRWTIGLIGLLIALPALDFFGKLLDLGTFLVFVWSSLVKLGPWIILPTLLVLHLFANWDKLIAKFSKVPFEFRPICGNSLAMRLEHDIVAKLAIRNVSGRRLEECSVKLVDAFFVHHGDVWSFPGMGPSINRLRGESFLLRWSAEESATSDRKYLDIPSDGLERFVDVLIIEKCNPSFARFAAADRNDLIDKCSGVGGDRWWKLTIAVSSNDGSNASIDLAAAYCERDPGPIDLHLWADRGQQIIDASRQKKSA